MKMKFILAASLAAFMNVAIAGDSTAAAPASAPAKPNGMWTFMAGTAKYKPESGAGATMGITADLYETGALYRFNNGLMVGGKLQQGYSNKLFPDESRKELMVGYSTRYKNIMPYVLAGYGWRNVDSNNFGVAEEGNFHWVKAGSKVMLSPKFFVSGAVRYRDSSDYNMRDNTIYYGAGVNLTKDVTVELEVNKATGQDATADSSTTSLIFSKRFF